MSNPKHLRHYHRHVWYSYPASRWQKFYSLALAPLAFIIVIFLVLRFFSVFPIRPLENVSFTLVGLALGATFMRLLIAYILSVVFSIPLALIASQNALAERILLPVFDITQSVPTLAFFPIIIIFFLKFNLLNGAAIFILFLGMLWNIVFSLVGGLKAIPADIKSAAEVFAIKGFSYVRRVLLPSTMPYLITGSLLAWAQGWNIIIVAEVLHTYIPDGSPAQDLFGIGSVLVNAASSGENNLFLASIVLMVVAIAFLNFFVWQKLLHYAEKYKFE